MMLLRSASLRQALQRTDRINCDVNDQTFKRDRGIEFGKVSGRQIGSVSFMRTVARLITTLFPSRTSKQTARSTAVILVLFGLVIAYVCLASFDLKALNVMAAITTALGVVFLAVADARDIGDLDLGGKGSQSTTKQEDPSARDFTSSPAKLAGAAPTASSNPPGALVRLAGHGFLIAGAIYLVAASLRS